MKNPATRTRRNGSVRCAIYTRKSSEEGLEQEFNSLQAQREACEAFITSQRHEGWMYRLTLNVLLSFAQFEREGIGERIRDKIAASKRKGMWMGGVPPFGYRAQDRKLIIVDSEAEIVRFIFRRYAELGSVRWLKDELEAPEHPEQVADQRLGPHLGREAIRPWCALPDATEPHLSRRDR
jgi:DNA invertase Pin-like site-specific DNA recombinase